MFLIEVGCGCERIHRDSKWDFSLFYEKAMQTIGQAFCCPCVQLGAVKLVLWRHWMHLNVMLPVTSENQFHCTRLYDSLSGRSTRLIRAICRPTCNNTYFSEQFNCSCCVHVGSQGMHLQCRVKHFQVRTFLPAVTLTRIIQQNVEATGVFSSPALVLRCLFFT